MSAIEAMTLLPGDVTTPAAARRFVRSALESVETDPVVIETAELLTTELVTNAVVHTGCPAVLRMLFAAGGGVRVEVADTSDRPPRPRHAKGEDTNGRGLELVDGLVDRWGWQPEGAGKSIWCEVDRAPSVSAGASLSPNRVRC